MVFGIIYVQFSRKFLISDRSRFWDHFSTLCADFQSEFSTPHPGPKAILGHWYGQFDACPCTGDASPADPPLVELELLDK